MCPFYAQFGFRQRQIWHSSVIWTYLWFSFQRCGWKWSFWDENQSSVTNFEFSAGKGLFLSYLANLSPIQISRHLKWPFSTYSESYKHSAATIDAVVGKICNLWLSDRAHPMFSMQATPCFTICLSEKTMQVCCLNAHRSNKRKPGWCSMAISIHFSEFIWGKGMKIIKNGPFAC